LLLILEAAPLSRRSCMVSMLAPPRAIAAIVNTVSPLYTKKGVKAI
jgi:hypothetical protein